MEALGVTPQDLGSPDQTDPEAVYPYVDENGVVLYEVWRFPDKNFRQFRIVNGERIRGLNGIRRVLYRLPELLTEINAGHVVYLVEGEKDVHAFDGTGYVATTAPGGAKNWRPEFTETLRDAHVVHVLDRDESGRKQGALVKTALAGVAASYKQVEAKQGKDSHDHLVRDGLTVQDFVPVRNGGWRRIDLNHDDYHRPPTPPHLCGLIYAGKRHVISGPPEATKTLVSLIFGLELMRNYGDNFALVDFEMGPVATRQLLADLGATDEELAKIVYFEEARTPTEDDLRDLDDAGVKLLVLDSAAGAYRVSGLDDNVRKDAEQFAHSWIDPLFRRGITTILLDHVVKFADGRGKFQIGSERKLGTTDVHLGFDPVWPLTRGTEGEINVMRHKDRGGYLSNPVAARVVLRSDPSSHRVTWEFKRP